MLLVMSTQGVLEVSVSSNQSEPSVALNKVSRLLSSYFNSTVYTIHSGCSEYFCMQIMSLPSANVFLHDTEQHFTEATGKDLVEN